MATVASLAEQNLASAAGLVAAIGALVGLYIAARQLAARIALAKLTFEDSFTKEYRQLIRSIPTKALLGARLNEEERREALAGFYHYIDLCNEQAYLKSKGRITERTWREWRQGIEGNLSRPEFAAAWSYIAHYSNRDEEEFEDLRALVRPADYDPSNPYLPPPSDLPSDVVR